MTTTLVGTASDAGYGTTRSATLPAGAVAGDLVIATVATSRWPGLSTITAGLTEIEEILSDTASSTDSKVYLFAGRIGEGDLAASGTVTADFGSNENGTLVLQTFHSDAGDAEYQYAYNSHPDGSAQANPSAPSLTANGDGILSWLTSFTGTGVTGTVPSGYTQQEFGNRTHAFQLLGTKASVSGATGTGNGTLSADTAWNALHIEAHDPAAPAATARVWDGTAWVDNASGAQFWDGTAWVAEA